jgi:hypothetical protein
MKYLLDEVSHMNCCPKMLYGRPRHTRVVFSEIYEERELYIRSLPRMRKVERDCSRIYEEWCKESKSLKKNIEEHYSMLKGMSESSPRFLYSPLSSCMIRKSIKSANFSEYGGKMSCPSVGDLMTTKGSFCRQEKRPSKSAKSVLSALANLPGQPQFILDAVLEILVSERKERKDLFLMSIFPKDQTGGDRDIQMMSGELRIVQSVCESIAKFYEGQSSVGKLSTSNKDREFLDTLANTLEKLSLTADQTRWGPNFNTRTFGDMFTLMEMEGLTGARLASQICYMVQTKVFLQPESDKTEYKNLRTVLIREDKDQRVELRGMSSPSHMGEGIFHYSSSLYHSLVIAYYMDVCRELIKMPLSAENLRDGRVTSDDLNVWFCTLGLNSKQKRLLSQCYVNIQSLLIPFGILTSSYKNIISTRYVEFNSMALLVDQNSVMITEPFKHILGAMVPFQSNNPWTDFSSISSRFSSCLNNHITLSSAYLAYSLLTIMVLKRWGMSKLFFKTGFLRILSLEDLIRGERLFPDYFEVAQKDGQLRIRKLTDSYSPFRQRTYEKLAEKLVDLSLSHTRFVSDHALSLASSIRSSPASIKAPLTRLILPSSFSRTALVPMHRAHSAQSLIDEAAEYEYVSLRLDLALSCSSWSSVSTLKAELKEEKDKYLQRILEQASLSVKNYTTIYKMDGIQLEREFTGKKFSLIRSISHSPQRQLSAEHLYVYNFGSILSSSASSTHLSILSRSDKSLRLNPDLVSALEPFRPVDKFEYLTHLVDAVSGITSSASLRILGTFSGMSSSKLRHNYIEGAEIEYEVSSSSASFPSHLILNETKTRLFQTGPYPSISGASCYYSEGKHNTLETVDHRNHALQRGLATVKCMTCNEHFSKPSRGAFLVLEEEFDEDFDEAEFEDHIGNIRVIEDDVEYDRSTPEGAALNDFAESVLSASPIDELLSRMTNEKSALLSSAFSSLLQDQERLVRPEEETKETRAKGLFDRLTDPEMKLERKKIRIKDIILERSPYEKYLRQAENGYYLRKNFKSWLKRKGRGRFWTRRSGEPGRKYYTTREIGLVMTSKGSSHLARKVFSEMFRCELPAGLYFKGSSGSFSISPRTLFLLQSMHTKEEQGLSIFYDMMMLSLSYGRV